MLWTRSSGLVCFVLALGPLAIGPSVVGPASWAPKEGRELIGTRAPEWRGIRWLQGGPLSLAALRGKVVLLRFWLIECPYCERSAPALRAWSEAHRGRGLVVVGLHHPKSEAAHDPAVVERTARRYGFDFPVGLDNDWATIRAYRVGSSFRDFTSVSFLIDRSGVIRFVHDGGEYHEGGGPAHRDCNAAHAALDAALGDLLSEAN